jgi:hypothetical protein
MCNQLELPQLEGPEIHKMTDSMYSLERFVTNTTMEGGLGPSLEEVLLSNLRGALRSLINSLDEDEPAKALAWVLEVASAAGNRNWFIKRKAHLNKLTRQQFIQELEKVRNEVGVHSRPHWDALVYDGVALSMP